MQVTRDNFWDFMAMASFDEPWIHNEKMDVSGGITTIEDIDELAKYPDCDVVTISGLAQDTFEYFIKKYGQQFKAIRFHKNKRVSDWSLLSHLSIIKVTQTEGSARSQISYDAVQAYIEKHGDTAKANGIQESIEHIQ